MVIGRSEDRDNPWGPMVLGHHLRCLGPDPRTPSGPAVIRPHTKAGHMTAFDQTFTLAAPLRDGGRPHMAAPLRDGGRPHMDPGFSPGKRSGSIVEEFLAHSVAHP